MSRTHLYVLCSILSLLGLSIFLYKVHWLHFPIAPGEVSAVWTIEANVSFEARNKPVKVSLYIPKNTARFAVMDETFVSRGFGLSTGAAEMNRKADWSIRKTEGRQNLFYRAIVRSLERDEQSLSFKQPELQAHQFEGAELAAAEGLLAEVRSKSADVESMTRELLQILNADKPNQNIKLLLGKKSDQLKRAALAVRVLALANIPARVVHGINLQSYGRTTQLIHWLEIYDKKTWHAFEASSGEARISSDYLPWWKGTDPLVELEGGSDLESSVSVEPRHEEAVESALAGLGETSPLLLDLSLFSLPIPTQMVYRVLLMIPLGALLVVILRNVVGLKTFGTFMPILIALAFRETHLLWGIIFFTLVVGLGLITRFYLEHLKLLLVPRLGSILIMVILLMAAISIICNKLGITYGLSIALFPMVIMTMTVERMSIVWDELGAMAALRQAIATLFCASLIYLLISERYLEHLFFVFPEIILIILALTLLLGRYTGYRFLELKRFKELAKASHV